ncbi:MAG: HTH domain-containing protein, partial [Muribaculaceae bacterium]|nr:HTH domain-containing protein [Muribaculaceae bacterium]
ISRKELSQVLGISQSAIQKHIQKLKENGTLIRIGGAKGGWWKVVK